MRRDMIYASADYRFPKSKSLSVTEPRFRVVYQSPRWGSCIHGGSCDLCDRVAVSPPVYTLQEAKEVSRELVTKDSMSRTFIVTPDRAISI